MRMFGIAVIVTAAFLGTVAQAQQVTSTAVQACAQQAKQQKLAGSALTDFLTRCSNGSAPMMEGNVMQRCEAEARRHTLSGEDRAAFMKRCGAGQVALPPVASSGPPTCEERARVRDLSGEMLSSFMTRCKAGQI
ncbi:MAG TPA: PsiF family protein [Vineibacter sp.]|nr:PsiF family protein [Vineibacter sp.]